MVKKNMIFHLCFPLRRRDGYLGGDSVRPIKMLQAFKSIGYDVDVIAGYKSERLKKIKEIKDKIKKGKVYDFLYSESSTSPTSIAFTKKSEVFWRPFMDFSFLKFANKNGIKIGVFYRDIYWKFAVFNDNGNVGGDLKAKALYFLHQIDLYYYCKFIHKLFLPSTEMAKYVTNMLQAISRESYPGCDILSEIKNKIPFKLSDINMLYVGSIMPPIYDLSPLINFSKQVYVTICCRKKEWDAFGNIKYEIKPENKLNIVHNKTEKELRQLYKDCNLCAILRNYHPYLEFAMPLKLFEAIGHNIPILISKGGRAAKFVEENNIGWVIDEDEGKFNFDIVINEYAEKLKNILRIKDQHTWTSRAKKIVAELII